MIDGTVLSYVMNEFVQFRKIEYILNTIEWDL